MRTKDRAMMVLRPAMAMLAGVATKWVEFVRSRGCWVRPDDCYITPISVGTKQLYMK